MTENISVNFQNFRRKAFIKILKRKLDFYDIVCRLKITNSYEQSKKNNKKISDILNNTLQIPKTFSSGNIFYILSLIEEHYDFLNTFRNSICITKSDQILKDNHITFLTKQKELIEKLNKNFVTPKIIDEDTIKQATKKE